jgi:hypothetical protein
VTTSFLASTDLGDHVQAIVLALIAVLASYLAGRRTTPPRGRRRDD